MITTLVPDIYRQVEKKDGWFNEDLARDLGAEVATRLRTHFNQSKEVPTLRLSRMGPVCPRALWHSIHTPMEAESLPPWAEIKYGFGHVIEALAICLAKAAGHTVEGEQDEIRVDGIVGHRDCVIDGCIVDVKSTSSRGFIKFKDGSIENDDPFGYLDQLDGYLVGSLDDPLVRDKSSAYLLAIDKQLGHVALHKHEVSNERQDRLRRRIKLYKEIVGASEPPPCTCRTVPDGKSGNIRLDIKASYNLYKFSCFPSLRTFLYSDGPRYLARVERKPDVPEIDRYGNLLHSQHQVHHEVSPVDQSTGLLF